jgi:hypothetical protein
MSYGMKRQLGELVQGRPLNETNLTWPWLGEADLTEDAAQ